MCLVCFLRNEYQYKMRRSAQNRSDRFEYTLKIYKKTFIANFIKEKNRPLCKKYNNSENKKILRYISNIDVEEIENFFEKIIDIYFNWINANSSKSIRIFNKIIKDFQLSELNSSILDLVLFRGRKSKEFISHWDMFHIPFNRRYKIANQRYSLVGQPLLYLSKSPYCAVNELKNKKDLWISSFRFTKQIRNFKIFDNTNHFSKIIKVNNDNNGIDKINNKIESYTKPEFNEDKLKTYFLHLILLSCCSFIKRIDSEQSYFCEEYVLPQILAQVLKSRNYKGIIYTSTKSYGDKNLIKIPKLFDYLTSNICLFTNYNHKSLDNEDVTYVYDKELYKKFKISSPILVESNTDKFCIDEAVSTIGYFINNSIIDRLDLFEKEVIYRISDILLLYNRYIDIYYKSEISQLLQLHCSLINNIILNIRDDHI